MSVTTFSITSAQAQVVHPLLLTAQKMGVEVVWSDSLQSSGLCTQESPLVIAMSKPHLLIVASSLGVSLETVMVAILAHELGHAAAYQQQQNFFSETFAWEIGIQFISQLYNCIPEDVITVGDHCLESYEACHGSIETAEVYMTQQFTEFLNETGF